MKITMEKNKNTETENLEVRQQEANGISQSENPHKNQSISQSGVVLDQPQISQVGDMFSQSGEPQTQTLTQSQIQTQHQNQILDQTFQIGVEQINDQVSQSEGRQNLDQIPQSGVITSTTGGSQSGATQVVSSQSGGAPRQGVMSTEFPGLIYNLDGTFTIIEQFRTWHKYHWKVPLEKK